MTPDESNSLIVKIAMKPGTSKSDFLRFTSWLDHHGKLLSDAEQTEDERFIAVACFDDGIDYLAFQVFAGFCRLA